MLVVKEQLIRLTRKNKEINASIQEMREGSVDELLSIMRTRKILIDQLGRSDLPDELRGLCLETLPKRKAYMYSKEEELISVEELLGGHESVLEYARSACQELEEKIEAYEDAIKLSGNPGFTMDGNYDTTNIWLELCLLYYRFPTYASTGKAYISDIAMRPGRCESTGAFTHDFPQSQP
jgi:hypothetical protein